jgi:hypothetical protein
MYAPFVMQHIRKRETDWSLSGVTVSKATVILGINA